MLENIFKYKKKTNYNNFDVVKCKKKSLLKNNTFIILFILYRLLFVSVYVHIFSYFIVKRYSFAIKKRFSSNELYNVLNLLLYVEFSKITIIFVFKSNGINIINILWLVNLNYCKSTLKCIFPIVYAYVKEYSILLSTHFLYNCV